jgi:1,4-dihydroxy-6-naphthoate synthase
MLELQQKVDRLIKKSIEYAFENYPELNDYIRSHSQEMSEDVMRKHIDLYVNQYSLNLGENGKAAIKKLLNVYAQLHPGTDINGADLFLI